MILTNGCSFTEGYDLPNPQQPWPNHVASNLKINLSNISLGGSSNKRIFRTAVEEILKNNPNIVIIGWTFHNRTELTHEQGFYCRYTNSDILPDFADTFEPSGLNKIHKFWSVHNHNEFLNYREFVYNTIILQEIFDKRKIKYKFFMALDNNYFFDFLNKTDRAHYFSNMSWHWEKPDNILPSDNDDNFYVDMLKTVEKIDLSKWVLPNTNMQTVLSENKFKTDSTGHFYEDGHKYWSKIILDSL